MNKQPNWWHRVVAYFTPLFFILAFIAPTNSQAQTTCPVGQVSSPQQGFAIAAFQTNTNNTTAVSNNSVANAAGPILPPGSFDQGAQSVQTFFNSIDLEFTAQGQPFLPGNSTVILSIAQFSNNNADALIQSSIDGVNYTDIGTIGFGNTTGNIATVVGENFFQQIPITLPAAGARYVRLNRQSGGFRVDGGQRGDICIENLVPITALAVDDNGSVNDVSVDSPSVLNVTANDTLDGAPFPAPNAPGSTTTIVLSFSTALPPELSFNVLTGDVGTVQNAADGTYSFDYVICETNSLVNCDTATVTIVIDAPPPPGIGQCPIGQSAIRQEGFAIAAFFTDTNNSTEVSNNPAANAVGPILAPGSFDEGTESESTFFNSIDLEFTPQDEPFLPGNATVILSVAQFFGGSAEALVQSSTDGVNFTDIGTIGFNATTGSIATVVGPNLFQQVPVTLPPAGARYVRLNHQNGGFRVDGGQRSDVCVDGAGAITAVANNDDGSVEDVSVDTPSILNVTANDTLDGAPFPAPNAAGSTTTLVLSSDTPLPPELTFDVLTGDVGAVQNAANDTYSFDYIICETSSLINCDTATVTVIIDAPPPPASGACPAGQSAVTQQGFAIAAFSTDTNATSTVSNNPVANAVGPILPVDSVDTGAQSQQTFFLSIDLEFTAAGEPFLPGNSTVILSVAQFFAHDGLALIQSSTDGTNFTDIGTIGFNTTAGSIATVTGQNIFQHIPVVLPAGGARYVRLNHQAIGPNAANLSPSFRVDGGQRDEICQVGGDAVVALSNTKTVEGRTNQQFSIPGSDIVYTIRIENVGDGVVDADTIFLTDALPPEVAFLNVPFSDSNNNSSPDPVFFQQSGGAGLSFDFATDIGFSTATTAPTNFGQCTTPLIAGENPDITFICFNPKGAMATGTPAPSFEFKFITRIQ